MDADKVDSKCWYLEDARKIILNGTSFFQ